MPLLNKFINAVALVKNFSEGQWHLLSGASMALLEGRGDGFSIAARPLSTLRAESVYNVTYLAHPQVGEIGVLSGPVKDGWAAV